MKTNSITVIGLAIALVSGCQPKPATDDPEKIKKVLTGYFEGIEKKDTASMRKLTTRDFMLYENGAVWNNDSAFMNIRRNMPFTVNYKYANFKIHVDDTS